MSNSTNKQRGSALLVSLMVMVGLSLLGLAYVAVTETESNISVAARNYSQTHGVAEAGAKIAVEWFQDPNWANANNILPPNSNDFKRTRTLTTPPYTGKYKDTGLLLFDKPFKPTPNDRFYGAETSPDILIDNSTATGTTFLTRLNSVLFNDLTNGEITEIRMFAPPTSDAVLTGGFYNGGSRYGICTIKVTATRYNNASPRTMIAQRWVKVVISEWPFPGPQGPVQSNANISTGGNFGVHWGRMTSETTMDIKRPLVGLPWFDAWDSVHFEHGYYVPGFDSNNVANSATNFQDQYNWLYAMLGQQLEDPWYEARAKGAILNSIAGTSPHPFKVTSYTANLTNIPDYGYSNWFQGQDHDDGPPGDYKLVVFPKIDYEFWKNISQAASTSTSTVHYLKWSSGENFTDGVTTKRFAQWVNTVNGAKPGFYFFDTKNGLNPQGAGAPGVLTPAITVNASDDGNEFSMKGFIYLNAVSFGTTGIRGPGGYYNFPGEPFRDVGYRNVASNAYDGTIVKAGNGQFDYQDLNDNKRLDIYIDPTPHAYTKPNGTATTGYFPVPWFPSCVPGFNGVAGANCSEPHEPYLNLIYPAAACCNGGGAPNPLTVGWENPSAFTQVPTSKSSSTGAPIPCNTALSPPDPNCTHNGRNEYGAVVENFGNQPNTKPIMEAVLYNEGAFDTQGNAAYYGSILINGEIQGTGTPEVWFDECLVRGCWQDKFTELPRVYVTSMQTDQ